MIFELGKSYIVDVTEKGIIPLMEFDNSKWYNKDQDDLDFLTDEEKDVIINSVLNKIRAEIEELKKISEKHQSVIDNIEITETHGMKENNVLVHNPQRERYMKFDGKLSAYDEVLEIIDKFNSTRSIREWIDSVPTIIGADAPKRVKGTPLEENDSGYNCENWIP